MVFADSDQQLSHIDFHLYVSKSSGWFQLVLIRYAVCVLAMIPLVKVGKFIHLEILWRVYQGTFAIVA